MSNKNSPPAESAPATIGDVWRLAGSLLIIDDVAERVTLDWSTSTAKRITIGARTEIAFENPHPGMCYVVEVERTHTGETVVEWPDSVIWATSNRGAPDMGTLAGLRDVFAFYADGAGYVGTEYARGIPVTHRS